MAVLIELQKLDLEQDKLRINVDNKIKKVEEDKEKLLDLEDSLRSEEQELDETQNLLNKRENELVEAQNGYKHTEDKLNAATNSRDFATIEQERETFKRTQLSIEEDIRTLKEAITKKTGARMIKEAVSGTTLVDEDDTSYVARMHSIPADEKIDLFVVQLSTNDASRGKPLGEIREARPFDTKTVTGAIQEILAYVRETWNCPVVFYTGSYYESAEYDAMVKRLYELQETESFGIADLYTDKAFNDITDEQRALYMFDPIHPVKAGYLCWWAPEIEKQIIAYLK